MAEENIVYVKTENGIFKCYKSESMHQPIYYTVGSKMNGYIDYNEVEKILTIEDLYQENQELNKENDRLAAKLNKNKILQNEFIKYLEDEIKACNAYSKYVKKKVKELKSSRLGKTYISIQIMKNETTKECYEDVLLKYKEITGVKDEI